MIKIIFLVFPFFFISCVGLPPVREYNKAYYAIAFAKRYEAKKFAPESYAMSLENYEEAIRLFEDRKYRSAKDYFLKSVQFSEKAENISRKKRYEMGDFSI